MTMVFKELNGLSEADRDVVSVCLSDDDWEGNERLRQLVQKIDEGVVADREDEMRRRTEVARQRYAEHEAQSIRNWADREGEESINRLLIVLRDGKWHGWLGFCYRRVIVPASLAYRLALLWFRDHPRARRHGKGNEYSCELVALGERLFYDRFLKTLRSQRFCHVRGSKDQREVRLRTLSDQERQRLQLFEAAETVIKEAYREALADRNWHAYDRRGEDALYIKAREQLRSWLELKPEEEVKMMQEEMATLLDVTLRHMTEAGLCERDQVDHCPTYRLVSQNNTRSDVTL